MSQHVAGDREILDRLLILFTQIIPEKKIHVYAHICVSVFPCKEREDDKVKASKYKQLVNTGEGCSEFPTCNFSVGLNL